MSPPNPPALPLSDAAFKAEVLRQLKQLELNQSLANAVLKQVLVRLNMAEILSDAAERMNGDGRCLPTIPPPPYSED